MIARVRGVIAASTPSIVMFHVAVSQSTATGTRPALTTAAAQLMIVKVGMMTSSPGFKSQRINGDIERDGAVGHRDAVRRPATSAIASSNRLTKGPSDEIQPVRIHSARYSASFPSSNGVLTGMNVSVTGPDL